MAKKQHTVAQSRVNTVHIVLPHDTNTLGTVFGGKLMQWVDIAATIASVRHCRMPVVTASIDELHFLHPVPLGHYVHINAEVTYTGTTSMEIEATVTSENPLTGEYQITSLAYLTFVGLGKDGQPSAVPAVVPETPEEAKRYAAAKKRKEARIQSREALKDRLTES